MLYIKVIFFVTLTLTYYWLWFSFISRVNWLTTLKGALSGIVLILPLILFWIIPSDYQPSSDLGSPIQYVLIYLIGVSCAGFIFGFLVDLFNRK